MKVSSGAGDGERCRRGSSVARRRTDVTRNVIQLYLLSNSYYYIHAIIYYIVFACWHYSWFYIRYCIYISNSEYLFILNDLLWSKVHLIYNSFRLPSLLRWLFSMQSPLRQRLWFRRVAFLILGSLWPDSAYPLESIILSDSTVHQKQGSPTIQLQYNTLQYNSTTICQASMVLPKRKTKMMI